MADAVIKVVDQQVVVRPFGSELLTPYVAAVETSAAAIFAALGDALIVSSAANFRYFIGNAGNGSVSGTNVIGFGYNAARDITSGINGVYVGTRAGKTNTTGGENVLVGFEAGELVGPVNQTVSIGSRSGGSRGAGSLTFSVAVGFQAGRDYSGEGLVAVGASALAKATGQRNTAVGGSAGSSTTTGARQTILGYAAQGGESFNDTIALGYNAQATASGQIRLGTAEQKHMFLFGQQFARWHANGSGDNFWLLGTGPATAPTGWGNLGVGKNALTAVAAGYLTTAVGFEALKDADKTYNCVAVGAMAAKAATGNTWDSVWIGAKAGRSTVSGVGDVAVGFRAMEYTTVARGCTAVGDSALFVNQGPAAVAMGYTAAEFVTDGTNAVFIGTNAGGKRLNAQRCVYIGKSAGEITSNTPNVDIATGTGGAAAGVDNVGIGYNALQECLGSRVTAVGTGAGQSLVGTVDQTLSSTFLGFYAGNSGSQKTDAANSMALGNQTYTTANNQVVLGNASTIDVLIGMGGLNTRLALRTTTPTSTAHINGSLATAIRTIMSTTTASWSDHTILCDAAAGAITLHLPAAAGCPGRVYVVKKVDASANAVTINPNSTETVDGALTKALAAQYETARVQSDGVNWFVI